MVSTAQLLDFLQSLDADAQEIRSETKIDDSPSIEQSKRQIVAAMDAELTSASKELKAVQDTLRKTKSAIENDKIWLSNSKKVQASKQTSDNPKAEFMTALQAFRSGVESFERTVTQLDKDKSAQTQNQRKRGASLPLRIIVGILVLFSLISDGILLLPVIAVILIPAGLALATVQFWAEHGGWRRGLTRFVYTFAGIFYTLVFGASTTLSLFGSQDSGGFLDFSGAFQAILPFVFILFLMGVWTLWKGIRNRLPEPKTR